MSQTPALILLVDDDIDCLEVNRHFLEAAGFRVACCFEPEEALRRMDTELPSLIVTDLMMRSIDAGFGFARLVKSDPRFAALPVVVMTAVASQLGYDFRPRTSADLQAMHVDAFLDKPVAPQTLVRTVQELLGHGRLTSHG